MKRYLGDSVYVEAEGSAIVLTTDNGYGASNTIVLEPDVYESLARYVAQMNAESGHPEVERAIKQIQGGDDRS